MIFSGEYYGNHSNETAPTSPTMSGSQVSGAQNQTSNLGSSCDCNNIQNVQEAAPTNNPSGGEGNPAEGNNPAEGSNPVGGESSNSAGGKRSNPLGDKDSNPLGGGGPSDAAEAATGGMGSKD